MRYRIALWYAVLLVAAIVITGVIVYSSLQSILYEDARNRIAQTVEDILRAVGPETFIGETGSGEQALANSSNLDHWASTTTFLQVDNAADLPEAHSQNFGAVILPPNPALSGQHPQAYRTVTISGRHFLVEDVLILGPGMRFTLHVAESLDQLADTFERTRRALVSTVLLACVAVVLLSFLLAAQITSPIAQLTAAMRAMESRGLHRRLHWRGRHDEIGELAEAFDDLLARLEEAFAREAQFIANASHELKTPLTAINANAQLLRRWGDADEQVRQESVRAIVDETGSLAQIVNGMLTLAKAGSGEKIAQEPVDLCELARSVADSARPRAEEKALELKFEPQSDVVVCGDSQLLRQLLSNLLENAIKFTQQGSVSLRVRKHASQAILEVDDTGPGIDAGDIPYVFDRFYRTDKSGSRAVPGTGLGLAIVRSIARVHDGTVEVERLAQGTRFIVRLPEMS